ncbi:MAG: hypothetical protein KIT35_13110 [Piscinibacter sp.]|uniref:hypothetical protein n=1 Tax=Piscinibacter TaxID=1114981 RepID=UPI000FDE298C|nr:MULTISPECIES: hypothetical protein [Piscinibacter]MCW5664770.1 hypothetical protein [Piscinibacter sp.]
MKRDPAPALDRRSGHDRRHRDNGPPDGHDRRTGLEPRQPEVHEMELTPSQWALLFGGDTVPADLTRDTVPADLGRDTVPTGLGS